MEKNISDNLKCFSDKPKRIKFWEMKKEFNLALFVVIKDYPQEITKKIKKLQDEIKGNLPKSIISLDDINKIEKEGLKRDGLYVYPDKDFHFTLINFLKYSVNFKYMPKLHPRELKHLATNYKHYKRTQNKIIKEIKKVTERQKTRNKKANLRWIYSGGEKGIDSVSLQVFLHSSLMVKLKKIKKETKECVAKLPWPNLGIKANPEHCPVAFTTNMLRFIKNTKKKESKLPNKYEKELINRIKKINKRHNNEPFPTIDIKEIVLYEVNDAFFHKRKRLRSFGLK